MNIKELNAINLFAVRHAALSMGVTRAAALFGCDPAIMETIKDLSDSRIEALCQEVEVPLFGVRLGKSHTFWRDAAINDEEIDWTRIARMRSLLIAGHPSNQSKPN